MDYSTLDDATLIRLAARAQTEALAELYDRYNRLVFSLALMIVGDRASAGEILLDVFTQVWKRAGTYRPDQAKVSTWLTAITRHHSIDVLRRRNSRPEANSVSWDELPLSPAPAAHDLEESMELSLQRQRIRAAIAQLPDDQQQALVMAYFKGYTHHEIASALNQPLGTIKTRIRLAMKKLRQALWEEQPPLDKSESASDAYHMDET